MYCKKIKLTNFRNISEAEIDFCDGINILAGENAQGKTNLLEAIFYASVGRSFRASSANEMILFGKKNATVSVDYMSEKKERHDNEINGNGKKGRRAGTDRASRRDPQEPGHQDS